jgi:nucleoid-associated protein YgaU
MRYKKRILAFNDNELYSEHFVERGVKFIDQYMTPKLAHATPSQIKKMNVINHSWTHGDKYYKLAHKYYDDSALWWVIAWFNKKPTESHVKIGEVIYIPTPINEVLKIYGLYY